MVTQPFRYPLDPTGVSPDNLVVGEEHTLSNRTIRAFAPVYGAFFTESVVVRDRSNNQVLERGVQYRSAELYEFPTGRWGKEICGIILVTDPAVSNDIEVDYQALGGEYSTNVDAIIQMFDTAMLNRPAAWPDILGRPDEFNPAAHFHDIGDVYGFEYVVNALERLRNAILVGDAASHDEILAYIDNQDDLIRQDVVGIQGDVSGHISNLNNPHSTTKSQVGLGSVENYPPVSEAEAIAGSLGNRYMTPQHTLTAILHHSAVVLATHSANTNNPHNTTKAHVGLGSVQNYPVASQSAAELGTDNASYMTPLRTAQAITASTATLTQHVARTDNPHSTTKSQVGLANVENYAVATQTEAEDGSSNLKYMTPLRTAQAIASSTVSLTQHVSNTNNPHNTTKSQVGLGSVENYAVASQGEAESGTSNLLYMTPLRVQQAVVQQAVTPLNQHTARTDNPHGTTKAQVGLDSVQNYPIASQAEAQSGTSNVRYMTPLRVAEAIAAISGTAINQHISNTNNPHSTTKSQVGLSNVENYAISTQFEAVAGNRNDMYMTPLRTAQAITDIALAPLNNHASNINNPHQVTKDQVGLGLVANLPRTSQYGYTDTSDHASYVTPFIANLILTSRFDAHNASGDHDARYALKGEAFPVPTRLITDGSESYVEMLLNGQWWAIPKGTVGGGN